MTMIIRKILKISNLLYRHSTVQNQKQIEQFTYNDPDDVFFCDGEGTDPSYTLDSSKAWAVKIENDEVYVYRIYSGSTIEYLTVHPLELLDRVGITGLTEYEMGYLNSYFYQIYQSGEIE